VLSLACAGGHLAVVELLLKSGANASHKLKVLHVLIHFAISFVAVVMMINSGANKVEKKLLAVKNSFLFTLC
jgi:ankyrin repeat protein